jgi:diamine N-acetyltransferase
MEKVVEDLRSKKATSLTLNVNKHNPAKTFYENLGFSIAKTEYSEVGGGYFVNDYVMELPLQNLPATTVNGETSDRFNA